MPATYSDEYIERWGNVYVANHIKNTGVPFDQFLRRPNEHLVNFMNTKPPLCDNGPYPLLQSQISVQQNLAFQNLLDELTEEGEADHHGKIVELHGDHLVEPIRQYQPAKKWKTNTRRKLS